jgi:hypothetical protein
MNVSVCVGSRKKILSKKKKVREGGEDGCPLVSVFFGFSRIWAARLILSPVNCNSKQTYASSSAGLLIGHLRQLFWAYWLLHPVLYIMLFILNPPWKCISIAQSQIMADLNLYTSKRESSSRRRRWPRRLSIPGRQISIGRRESREKSLSWLLFIYC